MERRIEHGRFIAPTRALLSANASVAVDLHALRLLFPLSQRCQVQPRLQAQVDVGRMSSRLENFQLQGAMCLGAALAQYGEVGKYSKHRCGSTVLAATVAITPLERSTGSGSRASSAGLYPGGTYDTNVATATQWAHLVLETGSLSSHVTGILWSCHRVGASFSAFQRRLHACLSFSVCV